MYLIVGLGNPGPEYEDTRHNIGFRVIDSWRLDLGIGLTGRRFWSRNARTTFLGKEIILLCPTIFMNLSGRSVKACADFYRLESRNILVIHDDLDLPLGSVKVVRDGGAGGHKGVLSIIAHLGGRQFPRIKIGIGRPRFGETIEDFVLAPFYGEEKGMIGEVTKTAIHACELFVSHGVETAMNHVNCQKFNKYGGNN